MIDVISYLQSRHIPYSTEGRNVSAGWVGIQCMYCDDHSNHLGIRLDTGYCHCWKCSSKSNFIKLITVIDKCSFKQARAICAEFSAGYANKALAYLTKPQQAATGDFTLPKFATPDLPTKHKQYLAGRHFNPYRIQRDYKIQACHTVGRYRHRLIIPIFVDGRLVNYVARDITGKASRRYITAPNYEAIKPGYELLYNIDAAGPTIVLVEGVFDMWRIGPGAVATLGIKLTEAKIGLLMQHRPSRVYVCFDHDAHDQAMVWGNKLARLVFDVEVLTISEGDPDTYFYKHPEELGWLKNELTRS